MTQALELITQAAQYGGIIAPGEIPDSQIVESGLTVLNQILDDWANDESLSFANYQYDIPIGNSNQGRITIGPSGDFRAIRPLYIPSNKGAITLLANNGVSYPITLITQEEFNSLFITYTSSIPRYVFYDAQIPNGVINIWPIPSSDYTLRIVTPLQDMEVLDQNQDIFLPRGYNTLLTAQMALRLLIFFPLEQNSTRFASLQALVEAQKRRIKQTNLKIPYANYDFQSLRRRGYYDGVNGLWVE